MREKLIARVYTIGVAVEGGTTAFASAYGKTKKFWAGFLIGVSGLLSRGAAAHYFQGPSILASASVPASSSLPSLEPVSLTVSLLEAGTSSSKVVEDKTPADAKEARSSRTSRALQGGYILVDSFNCLLSRYFIFNAFFTTFAIDLGNEIFGAIVISDFAIAQLFALLTATYAATKELADNGAKPIYANALKPFTNSTARTVMRYAGSAEFVVANYLIGWVTLTRSIINDLTEEEGVRDGVTIGVGVLSIMIGLIMFAQTYLFDGTYMKRFLEEVDPNTKEILTRPLPAWLLKLTDKTLPITAGVAAASSGTSVTIGVSQYTPAPVKWWAAGVAGLLDAVGIYNGAKRSQVREATEELKKMLAEQDRAAPAGAINSESTESITVASGQVLA